MHGRAAPPESCAADQRLTTRAAQEDRAAMRRAMDAACEPKGMGNEQLDSKTNFEGHSMNIAADAPSADSPYDHVYSTAHANKDTKSYFDAGMTLSDEADAGLAFDRVFGSQHEAARAETAFKNGFQLKKGYSVPRCSAPPARPARTPRRPTSPTPAFPVPTPLVPRPSCRWPTCSTR